MIPAHGGTPGLILELLPLVLLLIGGIAVWRRSGKDDSDPPGAGDKPSVE